MSIIQRLRNRHWTVYASLAVYSLTALFTVVESCLPGEVSTAHSNAIGGVVSWFLNLFPAEAPASISPTGIRLLSDSNALLNLDESYDGQIVEGTTSRLAFQIDYPEIDGTNYVLEGNFEVEKVSGGDFYDVVSDPANSIVRIVSTGGTNEDCLLRVSVNEEISYEYSFNIVERLSPFKIDVTYPESVNAGEAVPLNLALGDVFGTGNADELYARRYFDVTKLEIESDDELIVDPRGFIYAKSNAVPGIKHFSILDNDFEISVRDLQENLTRPTAASIVEQSGGLSLNDYDYENSGATFKVAYTDGGIDPFFVVSMDEMKAKPVSSLSTEGEFTIKGYRKEATEEDPLVVKVESAIRNDETGEALFTFDLSYTSTRIEPVSMTNVRVGCQSVSSSTNLEFVAGTRAAISTRMLGAGDNENVYDRSIHVQVGNTDIVDVLGNDSTTPTLQFRGVGNTSITISSRANPELTATFAVTITAPQNVDPTSDDFAVAIRKDLGHFGLFTLIGAFGGLFFALYFADHRKLYLTTAISGGVGIFLGFLTEGIQYLVVDRVAAMTDVGIDAFGTMCGLAAFLVIYGIVLLIRYIKNRPQNPAKI